MSSGTRFIPMLVEVVLSGRWTQAELLERGNFAFAFRRMPKWYPKLIERLLTEFPTRPGRRDLLRFLRILTRRKSPPVSLLRLPDPEMLPATGLPADIKVPALPTVGQLADWLCVTLHELDWFADPYRRSTRRAGDPLLHYRYRTFRKSSGGLRLLEIPKPRLKELQRKILHGILDSIPPHPAAHAYRTGRSIATYVAPHAGQRVLLHIDLRDFFPSVRYSRIHALFRTVGYPERVAANLAMLCTHRTHDSAFVVPESVEESAETLPWSWGMSRPYLDRHLPQGAPTSPVLANLSAWRLDQRLTALAKRFNANYTRYADDLLFSGGDDLQRDLSRFRIHVLAVTLNEGFSIRERKTRVMYHSQSQRVAGVVLNEHPNLVRQDFDQLKALLFNCIRFGPTSQNRTAHVGFSLHLQGRIAQMASINPQRGHKLQRLFDRIDWTSYNSQTAQPIR